MPYWATASSEHINNKVLTNNGFYLHNLTVHFILFARSWLNIVFCRLALCFQYFLYPAIVTLYTKTNNNLGDDKLGVKRNMLSHSTLLMRCSDSIASTSHTTQSVLPTDSTTPCSGHGDCLNGTCICEIRYSGIECGNFNFPYHASTFIVFIAPAI